MPSIFTTPPVTGESQPNSNSSGAFSVDGSGTFTGFSGQGIFPNSGEFQGFSTKSQPSTQPSSGSFGGFMPSGGFSQPSSGFSPASSGGFPVSSTGFSGSSGGFPASSSGFSQQPAGFPQQTGFQPPSAKNSVSNHQVSCKNQCLQLASVSEIIR